MKSSTVRLDRDRKEKKGNKTGHCVVHVDVSDPSQQFTHPESSISVSPQYTLLSPANLGGEGEGVCSLPKSRTVASVWRTVCPEVEKISFRR